ncbi:uncharacterized protein LOC134538796 [Bacillus rossius redtenbacheri]|uniref:uncharacterized protein LOC134538796 n=1 Tax=Bacillus rossius redtenbacheri TaxID=93214 RepID=UPI002FDCC92E
MRQELTFVFKLLLTFERFLRHYRKIPVFDQLTSPKRKSTFSKLSVRTSKERTKLLRHGLQTVLPSSLWTVLPASMWALLPAAMWALQPLRALPPALQPLLPALWHLGPAADRLHARHHGVHLQALLRQQLLLVLDVILAEIPTTSGVSCP